MTISEQVSRDQASNHRMDLVLNPDLDLGALRDSYARHGRVRISRILSVGARELFEWFTACDAWIQLISTSGEPIEMDRREWRGLSGKARRDLEAAIYDRAVDGFQYCYAALRVPDEDERERSPHPMTLFAEFIESETVQDMLEAVTGTRSPRFSDGQATAYSSGDFLTGHDDDVAGRKRTTACVFGLTPQWRAEWGGLLLFHEPGSIEIQGLVPQFNTLDLFAVPQYHSVSQITSAAPRSRFSVTGWLSPSE